MVTTNIFIDIDRSILASMLVKIKANQTFAATDRQYFIRKLDDLTFSELNFSKKSLLSCNCYQMEF